MTVPKVPRPIASSRRRWSFGYRTSDRWPLLGGVGRWIGVAMLSIAVLGTGSLSRPADAVPGQQEKSTPGPDKGRLVAEFHQDFRDGDFDRRALMVVGGESRKCVRAERGGLHIRIPAGLRNPEAMGVATRFQVRGDFEITATYEIIQADTPIRGYGLAATLWAETDTPNEEAVTIERGIIPREGERFTSTRISGPPEERKYDVRRARAVSQAGKLRMARVGTKVTTSFADGNKPFRALRTVELGREDVTLVRLGAETGVSDHALEIRLDDLTIRAEALPGLPSPRQSPGGSSKDSRTAK